MTSNTHIPYDTLSARELEILNYVNLNSERIAKMSIQAFAKEIHYSTSTVLRFCRKLGYSGYSEFKFNLHNIKKCNVQNNEPVAGTSDESDLKAIKRNILTDIECSTGLINSGDLFTISKLLSKNYPIYLHQPGGITNILVDYFESLLFSVGFKYVYKSASVKMTQHLIQTTEKPCIFAFISHSGHYRPTVTLAKTAKAHGITVLSVSSINSNDLAQISDYNLRYFAKIGDTEDADYNSRVCAFLAISSLIEFYINYMKG